MSPNPMEILGWTFAVLIFVVAVIVLVVALFDK